MLFRSDDVRYAPLDVNSRRFVPVIASSETTAASRFSDPAYYLNVAVGLEPETRDETPDERRTIGDFRSQRMAAAKLDSDMLKRSDAVVLSGMNGFKPAQIKLIRDYIQGGGCAIWFIGGPADTGVDPAFSNVFDEQFAVQLKGVESTAANESQPAFRINDFDPAAEPFSAIAGESSDSFRAISFYKRVNVNRRDSTNASVAQDVIAEFTDGSPAILRVSIGSGKLFLFLSSPAPDWSVLYRSRLFVPILHQTLKSCAVQPREKRDLICGEPLPDFIKTADTAVNIETGERRSLDLSRLRNSVLLPPGGWRIESASGGIARAVGAIAVNIDPLESDMEPRSVDELISADTPALKTDNESTAGDPPLSVQRQSKLWRWFLLSVALCLLAEGIVLAWDSRDAARVTP